MSSQAAIDLSRETLMIALVIVGPVLAAGLAIGLIIGIFQTVTSIQEATLTFIPKVLAMLCTLAICLPWMLQKMLSFTAALFMNLPQYGRYGH